MASELGGDRSGVTVGRHERRRQDLAPETQVSSLLPLGAPGRVDYDYHSPQLFDRRELPRRRAAGHLRPL
ncbi:hypothetical protein ACRAWD_07150 [Caulobacter segnis]